MPQEEEAQEQEGVKTMEVKMLTEKGNTVKLLIKDANPAFVNALRRQLMSGTTVFAVEDSIPSVGETLILRNDRRLSFFGALGLPIASENDIQCNDYCESYEFAGGVATEPEDGRGFEKSEFPICYCTYSKILYKTTKSIPAGGCIILTGAIDSQLVPNNLDVNKPTGGK